MFSCPVCSGSLHRLTQTYMCAKRHAYDISREGYVNLLLGGRKKGRPSGDVPETLRARRAIMDQGYFDLVSRELNKLILDSSLGSPPVTGLDVGCGEGYFLGELQEFLSIRGFHSTHLYGIDISKTAVSMAARRYPQISFAVGTIYRLPIQTAGTECLISAFSPIDVAEYQRVLHRDGILVVVMPGAEHLYGVRQQIYESPIPHPESTPVDSSAAFEPMDERRAKYRLQYLSSNDRLKLLQMTPHAWHTSRDEVRSIEESPDPVQIDVVIRAYKLAMSERSRRNARVSRRSTNLTPSSGGGQATFSL